MHDSESAHPAEFQITPSGRNRHGLISDCLDVSCVSSYLLLLLILLYVYTDNVQWCIYFFVAFSFFYPLVVRCNQTRTNKTVLYERALFLPRPTEKEGTTQTHTKKQEPEL